LKSVFGRKDRAAQYAERITERKGGFYRCNQCKEDFTVRTGTIFERSHVPLHKWVYAMYLLVTARKGISSMQLSKEIGITQKSAWFVLHRLREACGPDLEKLRGIIEIDETYIGGLEENKHASKKRNAGRGAVGKTTVLGMRERGGRVMAKPVSRNDKGTIQTTIIRQVKAGSTINTDEAGAYDGLGMLAFKHETVNHKAGEFVRDDVTTNGIESVFAVLKRGLIGVYQGNVKYHTLVRLNSFVAGVVGKRLTYKALIQ